MSPNPHPLLPLSLLLLLLLLLLLHAPLPSLANPQPPAIHQSTNQTRPTVAAILDPDLTDNNKPCCQNTSRFDLFARLVHKANVFPLLQSPVPLTLFAPNDRAVNQTADDLAPLLDRPFAQSESDAFSLISYFFDQFQNPNRVLQDVIRFHILKQSLSLDELVNGRHETHLPDQYIESFGPTLRPAVPGIILAESVGINVGPDSDIQASNGFLHTVDRLIFPDLSRYPLTPDSALTTTFATSLTPRPTSIPGTDRPPSDNFTDTDGPGPADPNDPPPPSNPDTPFTQSPSPFSAPPSPSTSPAPVFQPPQNPACFPATVSVTLHDQTQLPLPYLNAGHRIMATERHHSTVYLFTHREHTIRHNFIRLASHLNHTLTLSPGHLLYVDGRLTPAVLVKVGHMLRTLDGPSRVVSVRRVVASGLFAPHTMHGDIVVNRVVASTYTTAVHPLVAHAVLWPVRALVRAGFVEPLGGLFYGSWFGGGG